MLASNATGNSFAYSLATPITPYNDKWNIHLMSYSLQY